MTRYLPLILAGVLLNALAQITLKMGMRGIGHFNFRLENLGSVGLAVATSPFILAGLVCYVVSVVIWLLVLSRVEVSYAYPLLSVGYIVTALAGYLWLHEAMGPMRWTGIVVICLGVWLITRTG
ncbi:MAG: 4-amino-4-deoxy-L-arabinose transferase [Desulfobacterales bacterium CG2_30_60_27]|nr:MAG: 4-amino-4-deoxy-L-arabinose transferase [Desulfobacterales bacterium CG2_30_60_27]